ncbi:hypothetical protein FHR24_000796 [Wenyingzhuangia heitensis]|uniref:PQQ-like domain-containing protein n=1 Tax=Wenyingzhuangia heitensis TaxID=1487859 RepID=A0ABX0UBB3_9FLAO|nr:hypothetical protein [Wenyingzhuangia heitensis]NIJ44357.1 hypothetical protein [Wenyingzhuangia heitensis]
MKIQKKLFSLLLILFLNSLNSFGTLHNSTPPKKETALKSIDTKHTILKVRVAKNKKDNYIIGSSYEGIVIAVSYDGKILWENNLGLGIMNHDLWCDDITGDGIDEILVANANGTVYCLNSKGKKLWEFKPNDTPMYAVTVIHANKTPYIVCSNFDTNIYYLSATGTLIKKTPTSTFSVEKPWTKFPAIIPKKNISTANFIRPYQKADGSQALVIHGTNNQMNVNGTLYFFEPLANQPFKKVKVKSERVLGDFREIDLNNDGIKEIFLGTSAHTNDAGFSLYNEATNKFTIHPVKKRLATGYLITQAVQLNTPKKSQLFVLAGNNVFLLNQDLDYNKAENLSIKYAFNDICSDEYGNIILASIQSGGSCVHILNTKDSKWKKAYTNFKPTGKIENILKNTTNIKNELAKFKAPKHERKPLPLYFMTEVLNTPLSKKIADNITKNYNSPVFLGGKHMTKVQSSESWNRDTISNTEVRDSRDKRKKYTLTQQQVLNLLEPEYNSKGLATWGGHGNDPFYYSPSTLKNLVNYANGKKTVLIYPEMEGHGEPFKYVAEHLISPLATYGQDKNLNLFIRSKNVFWLGHAYLPIWSDLISGKYANVFVPSMEETTDKTMELSLAGRVGLWTSGAVNNWGTRAIMDNASFDRSREIGYQRLPNHFLRMLIFHTSYGAKFLNNFAVDQDYMSVFYDLIAKGAIYLPKPEEIVSFSPIHIGMKNPSERYMNEGANVKWTTFYDEKKETENKYVFSRMNGTWPGAAVTPWDFSSYAAGVKDRRLNFLAPYNSGLVIITPPQKGIFADTNAPRGALKNHLHPLYKNIIKEYITDGDYYYSADGKQTYKADEYYKKIEADIKNSAKKLPLTVTGENVAWVAAQTDDKHIRLTLIDGGYINPDNRKATVNFHTVSPVKITDVLDKKEFKTTQKTTIIDIPCGLFRFIDIELKEKF